MGIYYPLENKLLRALADFETWQVQLRRRAKNRVADALAKLSHPVPTVFSFYLPPEVIYIYEKEVRGGSLARLFRQPTGSSGSILIGRDLNVCNYAAANRQGHHVLGEVSAPFAYLFRAHLINRADLNTKYFEN